jgi:hypothetical protein
MGPKCGHRRIAATAANASGALRQMVLSGWRRAPRSPRLPGRPPTSTLRGPELGRTGRARRDPRQTQQGACISQVSTGDRCFEFDVGVARVPAGSPGRPSGPTPGSGLPSAGRQVTPGLRVLACPAHICYGSRSPAVGRQDEDSRARGAFVRRRGCQRLRRDGEGLSLLGRAATSAYRCLRRRHAVLGPQDHFTPGIALLNGQDPPPRSAHLPVDGTGCEVPVRERMNLLITATTGGAGAAGRAVHPDLRRVPTSESPGARRASVMWSSSQAR